MGKTTDKVVAEMPKAENSGCSCDDCKARWIISIQDQCQLLAKQGWRKVPSVDQILYRLAKGSGGGSLNDADKLRCWLLEGE